MPQRWLINRIQISIAIAQIALAVVLAIFVVSRGVPVGDGLIAVVAAIAALLGGASLVLTRTK